MSNRTAALDGNPLAVFADARGSTDDEMQALAREMNLSQTTFVLPREPEVEAREGTRVRIFTVDCSRSQRRRLRGSPGWDQNVLSQLTREMAY